MGEAARKQAIPQRHGRLTRGLASLLARTGPVSVPAQATDGPAAERRFMDIPIAELRANSYQPRREFDPAGLGCLAASIKESGVLQPVVVRRTGTGFELIAGERRLRAAKLAGFTSVPAVVRDASEDEMLALALVENMQRDNLNAIELAKAYAMLVSSFGLSHGEIATRLGVSRVGVVNALRLLELPEFIRDLVSSGILSAGHARAILTVEGDNARVAFAREILQKCLSVREAEARAGSGKAAPKTKARAGRPDERPAHLRSLEQKLSERFGTRVRIIEGKRKGKIVIEFHSNDDFERIMEVVGAAA